MRVFQTVVDEGGFAAAARLLELSPPVVTRLVADLEQHLGTRLLQRTTRKLALTEAGDAYLARVRAILHEIEDAEAAAAASTRDLRGTVRVVVASRAARGRHEFSCPHAEPLARAAAAAHAGHRH